MTIRVLYTSISRHPLYPQVPDLKTAVVRYPRFIHPELMTHRVFSRNASSSRAVPVMRMLWNTVRDMAAPVSWGSNKPGMQAGAALKGWRLAVTKAMWYGLGWIAMGAAFIAAKAGAHKQIVNRLIEPWSHITVMITATDWTNFFDLRRHEAADPTMHALADAIWEAFENTRVDQLIKGEWHTPFAHADFDSDAVRITQSVARAARTSYLNHDGTQTDFGRDLKLHDDLARMRHLSPFEHQAQAVQPGMKWGNLAPGWKQYRSEIE